MEENKRDSIVITSDESDDESMQAGDETTLKDRVCPNCTETVKDLKEHLLNEFACFFPLTKKYWYKKPDKEQICRICKKDRSTPLQLKHHCFCKSKCKNVYIDRYMGNHKWHRKAPPASNDSQLSTSAPQRKPEQPALPRCSICKREFRRLRDMKSHITKSHTNNSKKRHKATQHTSNTQTRTLPVPQRKPDKPLRVTCDVCKRTYCSRSSLNHHKASQHTSNTQTRTFAVPQREADQTLRVTCYVCKRTYCSRSSLNRHKATQHTSNTQTRTLLVPQREPDQVNGIICDVCKRKYSTLASLRSHKYRKHRNTLQLAHAQ